VHHTGPVDGDVIASAAAPSRLTTAGRAPMTYIHRQPTDPTTSSAEVATAPTWLLVIIVVVARPPRALTGRPSTNVQRTAGASLSAF
jgi:hypothetical protein